MKMKRPALGAVGGRGFASLILAAAAWAAVSASPRAGQAPPVTLRHDLTIGVDEGDEKLMFGWIRYIDVDGRGNIYILDYKFRRVSIFDSKGNLLRQIAVPEGQGPQEAMDLAGIAVTPRGTMFINDMHKVIVYGPDGRYVRTFLVDFMISSIGCPGIEELVGIGPHDGKILHVFDAQGKLVASFGDTFTPPAKFESMKGRPMFGAPLRFNCAKDGHIFVLNPHQYEVSVFKDRMLENVIKGRSDDFEPIQKMGNALLSTAADIVASGDLIFVALGKKDPRAKITADIFRAGRQIGSIDLPGTPMIADPEGMIYFAVQEGGPFGGLLGKEGFPRVSRYAVTKN
jgi:hypothetical protein